MSDLQGGADRGIAMISAVLALVLLGALVSGSLFVSARQARNGTADAQVASAFYAAEAGLAASFGWWDSQPAVELRPWRSVEIGSAALASGDSYHARLTQLDDGGAESGARYLLVSSGRAHGPGGGRRRVALLLRDPRPERWCCGAALTTAGVVQVADGGLLRGIDLEPIEWLDFPGLCQVPASNRPGVVTGEEGNNVFGEAEHAFRELAARSDVELDGGALLNDIAPVIDSDGACARGLPANWGEPRVVGHPCFDYLPVVHAAGDLTIASAGSGQGVLLVQGDLEITGDFDFYGLLIVLGNLRVARGRILGAALASGGVVRVGSGAELSYSSCAVRRALRTAKLVLPHPLAQFSWLEILE